MSLAHRLAELSREPPQRQAASSLRSDPKGKQTAKSASAPSRKGPKSHEDSEAGGGHVGGQLLVSTETRMF